MDHRIRRTAGNCLAALGMKHESCDLEMSTTFGEIYQGPVCDACSGPMLYDDGICDDCRTRQLEYEQDEAWPVFKASLRYGQD